ncbi:zinc knuckle CX2CX4HX4C containing protein [Tanacetum coccineum]
MIDGKLLGKDGKPLRAYRDRFNVVVGANESVTSKPHNPKGVPLKPILKSAKGTSDVESSIATNSIKQGSNTLEHTAATDNNATKQGSIADLFKQTQQMNKKIVKVSHITTFEEINGADVAIPKAVVDQVRVHFSNTLYGYFIGKRIPFLIVEKYVMNTWAKYGVVRAIIRNGFYLFKFKTKEGMEQVMENGPWTIRLSPLILNIWKPNTKLEKEEVLSIPVWVKLHKVPIVAYSEVGLSHITSKLGKPIMLDSYTCDICINPWGRSTYARALIEMSSDRAFVESLVVGIPLEDGSGHSMETISVEYEWKPPRCGDCKIFGHTLSMCLKRVIQAMTSTAKSTPKSDSKSVNVADNNGFIEEKKGPKNNQTQTTNQSKASTSRSAPSKNFTPMSNSFDTLSNLMEEGRNDPQSKVDGSMQTGGKESSEAHVETIGLSSKCINEPDIDDDDVFTSYEPSLGGGNQLEDEDLDFSDGYKDQVFDFPGQLKNFHDFMLNMSGRKQSYFFPSC